MSWPRRAPQVGGLPPIVLATLRRRMVELSGEIAQGAVWANGARSHMAASLRYLPASALNDPGFFIGNMVPTCIDDDRAAAAAVMRRTLVSYVRLPNYQNYWTEAGYEDEMLAIRAALARGETQRLPELMSDRWLRDVTLFGSMAEVREGVEAWLATGVRTVDRGRFLHPRRADGRPRGDDPRVPLTLSAPCGGARGWGPALRGAPRTPSNTSNRRSTGGRPMAQLAGRVALITGASKGVGRVMSRMFARRRRRGDLRRAVARSGGGDDGAGQGCRRPRDRGRGRRRRRGRRAADGGRGGARPSASSIRS